MYSQNKPCINMEQKDYSLLRPFDLEAAKRGENLQTKHGDKREFVGGYSADGNVCVAGQSGQYYLEHPSELRIAPLAWVEGKPVYKGDVLYYTKNTGRMDGPIEMNITSSDNHGLYGDTVIGEFVGNFENLTWQKPKAKRDGWVNILPASYHKYPYGYIYPSEQEAKESAPDYTIATAYVSWEE